ncbi:MAG: hypothetical protein JWM81_776 [Candidatus Saccharibacteria bacterium]|nr:hypothetical protein [Candidatus Saccharibacteria bacterium]
MITTQENIINPAEFLQSSTALLDTLSPGQTELLSGADFDVEVYKRGRQDPDKVGHVSQQVSRLMGDLYLTESLFGLETDAGVVDLQWYPSPAALNGLAVALGLEPGHNVLRATHYEGARGWSDGYNDRLKVGEYPVSVTPKISSNIHQEALGSLLLPPSVTDAVVRIADTTTSKKHRGYVATEFQQTMPLYARLVDRLSAVEDGEISMEDAIRPLQRYSGAMLHPAFWKLKGSGWIPTMKKQQLPIAEMTANYLEDLKPKIEALKAA